MTVPIPQQPFTIGGRYQVLRKLGGGAMGAVFLAEDLRPNSHRQVAIKVPATSRHWRAEYVRRVVQEIGILSALQHPNIVEILDSGQDAQYGPFIVMEYVKGVSVRQFMAQHPGDKLPPNEAVRIAAAVADALAYAHTRPERIIHRDIKPDNILLREADRQIKVSDFGLAAVLTVKRADTQWGTPDYIAPEQALGRGADERSDLYALAATLYHMVTGLRPPPLGASAPQRPSSVMVPGVFDQTQARWLDSLILNLLAYDPNYRRPTRAAEVAEVLRAILGARPAPVAYPLPEDSAVIPALMQRMVQPPQGQPRPRQPQGQPRPRPQPAPAQPMPQMAPAPPPAPTVPAPASPAKAPAPLAPTAPAPAVPTPPSEQVFHPPVAPPAPLPQAVVFPQRNSPPPMPPQVVPGFQPPPVAGRSAAPQSPPMPLSPPPAIQRPAPARPLPAAQPAPGEQAQQRPAPASLPQQPVLLGPVAPAPAGSTAKDKGRTEYEFVAGGVAGLVGLIGLLFAQRYQPDADKIIFSLLLDVLIIWMVGAVAGLLSPRGRRGNFPGWAALGAILVMFFGTAILSALKVVVGKADLLDFLGSLLLTGFLAPGAVLLGALATWMALVLIGKE
jgi:serine/threonine protein kinase